MLKTILKSVLPPEDKGFYRLFEASTENIAQAAQLFRDIIKNGLTDERLNQAHAIKAEASDLSHKVLELLNSTFITPLDREDITSVTFLLEKISKRIIRGCVNLRVYRLQDFPPVLHEQANTLVAASEELKVTVCHLKRNSSLKLVTESHQRMKAIETKGDQLLFQAMDDVFSGRHDALTVIKLRDEYRTIESALDNCFNVTDLVLNIVIKQA